MEFLVRPMEHTDIRAVYSIRLQEGVFRNLSAMPSDTLTSSEDFFTNTDPAYYHFYVAEARDQYDVQVVGAASLVISNKQRQRHVAALGIMVHEGFQGRGVGRALMERLIDLSDNWLALVRLELDVFADNKHAIRLYESLGFVQEGIKQKAQVRLGKYEDLAFMARINTGVLTC